jgi:hypothetical protein
MEPVKSPTPPKGYVLSEEHGIKEVLAVEAELLRSEGIDPEWPGFPDDPQPIKR